MPMKKIHKLINSKRFLVKVKDFLSEEIEKIRDLEEKIKFDSKEKDVKEKNINESYKNDKDNLMFKTKTY
jgi:hypothetical protein